MSSKKKKSSHLYSLQKLVVLYLARKGPQTINKTAKDIGHSYKPTYIAFTTLERKKIIRKGEAKNYNGREFPLYWVTEEGAFLALTEGASPTDLLTTAKQVYPNNQRFQFGLGMAQHVNPKIFEIALTALRTKGKLEPAELASIMITQMQTNASMRAFTEALETYRKYPTEYEQFKQRISQIQENFNKLKEIIDKKS
jgi:hypothetical protein